MGRARAGTFLDKKVELRNSGSEEDNFDVVRESAGKLPILRPILKVEGFKPLHNLARRHIIQLVKDAILSLSPPKPVEEDEWGSQNVKTTIYLTGRRS